MPETKSLKSTDIWFDEDRQILHVKDVQIAGDLLLALNEPNEKAVLKFKRKVYPWSKDGKPTTVTHQWESDQAFVDWYHKQRELATKQAQMEKEE